MEILEARKNCEVVGADTPLAEYFRISVDVWNDLAQGDAVPVWKIDHMLAFPADLIAYANVTVWEPDRNDHRFLFWGSGRTEMMRCDYTNKPLSDLQPPVYAELVKADLDEVLSLRKPLKSSARVLLENGTETQVDKIRLPFRDKHDDITVVLSLDDVHQFLKRYYLSWQQRSKG